MNRSFLAVALALSAIACSHSKEARAPSEGVAAATPAPPAAGTAEACALGIPGTTVAAKDTIDGAALDFTTSPDKVVEVRQRVRDMVAAHQAARREAQGMHGMPDTGADTGTAAAPTQPPAAETGTGATGPAPVSPPMPGMESMEGMPGMMQGPPGTATVVDTPSGVRVAYTPNEGVDPQRARSAVRAGAARIQDMPCQR